MLLKYLTCFFISMVPLVELRLAVPMAVSMGLDYWPSLVICVIGNLLPVPIIYFFARKVLEWGKDKKYIGGFFSWCLRKGESGGHKLTQRAGRTGSFLALMSRTHRLLSGPDAVCGHSLAGHRGLDRNPGRQLSGYGHQDHVSGRILWGGSRRNHHGHRRPDRRSCVWTLIRR